MVTVIVTVALDPPGVLKFALTAPSAHDDQVKTAAAHPAIL
jgi:hypothetical protein